MLRNEGQSREDKSVVCGFFGRLGCASGILTVSGLEMPRVVSVFMKFGSNFRFHTTPEQVCSLPWTVLDTVPGFGGTTGDFDQSQLPF